MTASEAREAVTACRAHLDDAMRALSVPETDWVGAWVALERCLTACAGLSREAAREDAHGRDDD